MKTLLTAARLRAVIAGAMTEKDVAQALRAHRIRYNFTTAPGYLAIRVPLRSGAAYIVRTASRSAPLQVRPAPAPDAWPVVAPVVPVLHPDY